MSCPLQHLPHPLPTLTSSVPLLSRHQRVSCTLSVPLLAMLFPMGHKTCSPISFRSLLQCWLLREAFVATLLRIPHHPHPHAHTRRPALWLFSAVTNIPHILFTCFYHLSSLLECELHTVRSFVCPMLDPQHLERSPVLTSTQ